MKIAAAVVTCIARTNQRAMALSIRTLATVVLCLAWGCDESVVPAGTAELQGATTFSPFDATALAIRPAARVGAIKLVSSSSEAGRLLQEWSINRPDRVDWILCSQGVVAYLVGTGAPIRVVATTYASDATFLPVWRKGRPPAPGQRTQLVPATSIELALSRFLAREGIPLAGLHIVNSSRRSLSSIADALKADSRSEDAIDFGVLADPYLTELMKDGAQEFEVGSGGLYRFRYCLAVAKLALDKWPREVEHLLRELVEADTRLAAAASDDQFYTLVTHGGQRLPRLMTFDRTALRVELAPEILTRLIRDELDYLVMAYPAQFRMPVDLSSIVDPSLLNLIAPKRVLR